MGVYPWFLLNSFRWGNAWCIEYCAHKCWGLGCGGGCYLNYRKCLYEVYRHICMHRRILYSLQDILFCELWGGVSCGLCFAVLPAVFFSLCFFCFCNFFHGAQGLVDVSKDCSIYFCCDCCSYLT